MGERMLVGKVLVGARTLAFGVFISACSADIDSARKLVLEGEDFSILLAKNYREHSIFEVEQMYDWPDAFRYARKPWPLPRESRRRLNRLPIGIFRRRTYLASATPAPVSSPLSSKASL